MFSLSIQGALNDDDDSDDDDGNDDDSRLHFPVYVSYCAAQPSMDRRLKQLGYYLPRINWRSHKVGKIKIVKLIIFRQSSASFSETLQDLENDQVDVSLNVAQMHKLTDMQKYK